LTPGKDNTLESANYLDREETGEKTVAANEKGDTRQNGNESKLKMET
jgi:hypothetical protein